MIKSVLDLFSLIGALFALYRKARREGWLQEGHDIAVRLTKVKSDEKRVLLLKRLSEQLSRM